MKKYLNLIGLIILSSNSFFIAYVINNFITTNNSYNEIKTDIWANQSANLIKAIVKSKEKNIDTLETIHYISKNTFNNEEIKLNSWQDIQKEWGYKQIIKTEGFNPEKFFIKNKLNKEANYIKKIYEFFYIIENYIKEIDLEIYNTIKSKLEFFLNNLKVDNINELEINNDELKIILKKAIILIKNTILGSNWNKNLIKNNKEESEIEKKDYFNNNLIKPLISFLDFFINNQWSKTQAKTPSSFEELKDFMYSWKDEDEAFYSQWISKIKDLHLNEYDVEDWTIRDYDFYRSGVLINYVFYKIGKDYEIKSNTSWFFKGYIDWYLGDIIEKNLYLNYEDTIYYLNKDLSQYLRHLLENPQYILLLAQAIVPILKEQVIPLSSRNDPKYYLFTKTENIINIINKLEDILEDPEKINKVIDSLLDSPIGLAFKVSVFSLKDSEATSQINKNRQKIKEKVQEWINTNKEEINNYLFLIKKEFKILSKDLPNLNLVKDILSILLKEFNKEVIPVLSKISTSDVSNSSEQEVDLFIKSLTNFYNNIKNYYKEMFNNYIKEFYNIKNVSEIYNSKNHNKDLLLNKYIKQFYETNEISKIYDIKKIKNNLSYTLEYKINDKTYIFDVNCYINYKKERFYFSEIKLITIKK